MNSEPPKPGAPSEQCSDRRCEIQLQNPCRYQEAGARRLRPWIEPLVEELVPAADSFALRFVSDREMRRLNATYRRRDATTDVLSFPGDLVPSPEDPGDRGAARSECHLGDVVVSVPAARRQASKLGHSVERELRILTLHGVLHCMGHDHETDGGTMERLERRLRLRYVTDE